MPGSNPIAGSDDEILAQLEKRSNMPDDMAWAMPGPYYTSASFLNLEISRVLNREWMCVGHVDELTNDGDFFTVDLLGEPLLIVRDRKTGVRVFSNVCRHRGNRVAHGTGNAKKFTCQYHSWTYDTAGSLKVAPHMSKRPAFNQSKCGLLGFASEVWMGWIFVNLDGNAEPLAPRLADLDSVIKNYHQDHRTLVHMEEDVWRCNWKALFENFMEGYHLSATHLETLHPITPTSLCKKMKSGDAWTGYHACYDPTYPPREPFHPDLTEFERTNSPMYGVYPNLMVGMGTDFTLFMIIQPDGPDQVRIRWGVTGHDETPASAATQKYVELCRAFNAEDKEKLEILQDALKSRFYPGGPLAPDDMEGTIWDFLQYMARQILKTG